MNQTNKFIYNVFSSKDGYSNSQMRDFYDIQVLYGTYLKEINRESLAKAITETAEKREPINQLQNAETVMRTAQASPELQQQ